MDFLILCLSALVFGGLAGFALYAVTCVTAVSELFAPIREWLKRQARPRSGDSHRPLARSRIRVARFFHALVICPFCSSWWHALWVLPVMHLAAGGSWRLVFLAYLPTIGIRAMIGMLHHVVYTQPAEALESPIVPIVNPSRTQLQDLYDQISKDSA